MSRWTIYDKNGNVRHNSITEYNSDGEIVYSDSLNYSGSWMAECSVNVSIKSPYPIDFHIGDYILYRGEKFILFTDPSVIKKARRGSYAEGFTYDNIKFCAHHTELTDIRFLDYVLDDNELHYTSLPEFPFYAASIDDYCDRLQANTNRWCEDNNFELTDYWLFVTPNKTKFLNRAAHLRKNGNEWEGLTAAQATAIWDEAYGNGTALEDEKKDVSVTVNNQSVWDSLSLIKSDFGLNFINRGRYVIIGSAGLPTNHIFEYGKGNGLFEMERHADTEQQVITRLYAYGSNKNMPVRYYANINTRAYLKTTSDYHSSSTNDTISVLLESMPFDNGAFKHKIYEPYGSMIWYSLSCMVGNTEFDANIEMVKESGNSADGTVRLLVYSQTASSPVLNVARTTQAKIDAIKAAFDNGEDKVIFMSRVNINKFPSNRKITLTDNLPNNMAVNKLMLPGFPNLSLYDWVKANGGTDCDDSTGQATWEGYTAYFSKEKYKPYIQSLNCKEIGIKEATKTFDGSDDSDEIYPTIKDSGYDIIQNAEVVNDNGVFEDGDDTPTITVKLSDLGDLDELIEEGTQSEATPIIAMTDGFCGGREFKILNAKKENNLWTVRCEREYDDYIQLYFPYSDSVAHGGTAIANECYQVRGADLPGYDGDHFVLTGIPLPDSYIRQASIRLLEAALEFLSKNDYSSYTYIPKVDELFMQRQHDEYLNGQTSRSLYLTIKEGDLLRFEDADLRIDDSLVFIDTLNIKENGNREIPTFEVTLRNDKAVGTMQRIQNQINSLSNRGFVSGYTTNQLNNLFEGTGSKFFLSKQKADVAKGLIGFLAGLWVKEEGTFGIDENGCAKLGDVDADGNLSVTENAEIGGTVSAATLIASLFKTPMFEKAVGMIGRGFGVEIDNSGKSLLQTNDLIVLGKMIVNSLNIREVTYIGGTYLLTPAGSTAYAVIPIYTTVQNTGDTRSWTTEGSGTIVGYRILWLADDGTTGTMNFWKQGDQAFCQTFNITEPGEYENASNRLYWRLVCRVGHTEVEGKTYHYVDVANVHDVYLYDSNGNPIYNTQGNILFLGYQEQMGDDPAGNVPASGDKVVALGSQADTTRQAAIQITAEGVGSFGIYDGINNYGLLSNYEIHFLSKDRVSMSANKFQWKTASGDNVPPTVYRGNWVAGSTAAQNPVSSWGDEWTYNGSNWICVISSGTTTEAPGTTAANWVENKGAKGDTVKTVTVFCPSTKQPTTPTGNTVPPAGWSLSPSVFGNGTDGTHAAWRELKGNSVNNAFIKERILINATEATTLTIEFAASSESNYDFIAVGSLDTALETRSNVTSLPTANKASGTESKSINISLTAGEHFIDVVYSKDGSASTNLDRGWYKYTVPSGVTMEIEDNKIWASVATLENNTLSGSWSTPVQWDGTNGEDGEDGEDGADAWTVIASPNPLILTQDKDNTSSFGLPIEINITAKCGDNAATVGTPTSVSNDAGLTITAASGKLTVTAISKVNNAYKTRGTITCTIPLTYNGRSASLSYAISVGINLMGEFKTTIEGDVEESVATKLGFKAAGSDIYSIEAAGNFVRSSAENISTLQQTVGDENSGLVKKTSEISQRVDDINIYVSETTNENLMPNPIFAEYNPFPNGMHARTGISSGLVYISNTGDTSNFHSPWERYGGMLIKIGINSNTNTSTQTVYPENSYVSNPRVHLTAGKTYTFSLYVAGINLSNNLGGDKRIAELSFYNSATGSSRTMRSIFLSHTTGNASKRFVQYAVTFTVVSGYEYLTWMPLLDVGAQKYNFYALYAGAKLEEGGVPTVLSYDAVDGLIKTGINIEAGDVTVYGGKFKMQDNAGNDTFVLSTDGSLTSKNGASFGGTVKAQNFYKNECLIFPDPTYSNSKFYFTGNWPSSTPSYASNFVTGRYYTANEIYELSENDIEAEDGETITGYTECFILCTYDAELIYGVPNSNNIYARIMDLGGGNYINVMLPRPEDFEGKVVEVHSAVYGSPNHLPNIIVGCVYGTTPKFISTIYKDGQTLYVDSPATHKSVTATKMAKYRSIKVGSNYYWWQFYQET